MGPNGIPFPAGSEELARQCALPQYAEALVCSREALAHAMHVCARGIADGIDKYLVGPAIKPVFRRFN